MRVPILALTMSAVAALPAAAGKPCAAVATFGDGDKPSCVLGSSAALESLLAMPGGDDAATRARFDGGRSRGSVPASRAEFRPAFFPGGFSLPPPLPPPPTPLPPNSLTPSLGDAARISAPTPRTAEPVAAAPVRAAPPVAMPATGDGESSSSSGGDPGQTPCGDLRDKARRLRSAADQCDSDVGNGAPFCNVKVTFSRPSLPRTLSPGSARGYADEFESIADQGNEAICVERGGQGRDREGAGARLWRSDPYVTGNRKRCMDSYLRENYNDFVADTLVPYFSLGSIASREFWHAVFESAVVKGSVLAALGVGQAYYSAREYEALGKSLNEWGWAGILGRGSAIVGAATTAANIATAEVFLKGLLGVVASGAGSFATTAHAKAFDACATEAP